MEKLSFYNEIKKKIDDFILQDSHCVIFKGDELINSYVFQELEKIIFFNNLALDSLKKNDVVFSSALLGKISEIENIFKKKKNFLITSIDYQKIFLEYNPKENVENNS